MSKVYVLFEREDRAEVDEKVWPLVQRNVTELDGPEPERIELAEDDVPDLPEGCRILVWLSDDRLKRLLPAILERHWELALLPHSSMLQARLGMGVASSIEEALADAQQSVEALAVDVLYCNDQPVFNSVVLGDTYSLKPARILGEGLFKRLKRLLTLMFTLTHLMLHPFKLVTGKEKSIDTAALGIVAVEHGRSSPLSRRILEDSSTRDGMLHTLILAPRSVFELLRFLLASAVLPAGSAQRLPPFVGHIKSQSVTITTTKPMPYSLDGVNREAQELALRVSPGALQLVPGRLLSVNREAPQQNQKEVFKVQALPQGEARNELVSHPMPWFHHAATDEFRDLFTLLRDNARASESYLVLMVLSTLLATVGLFANSAPVIIGAMILAPLMAPIISLSMGLLRQDLGLMAASGRTLMIGIAVAIACAVLLAAITPLEYINSEIEARLKPTLLDLGVAVISGIAGAYAHARSEVARSLAGVAIAVALVPPLAVTGIGLGWLNWEVFWGALLLFLTNLAGILLAAALTFLYLGYSPFKRATRGLLVSLAMVVAVSVPLGLGFHQMVQEYRIINALSDWEIHGVQLRDVSVRRADPVYIRATLISTEPLEREDLAAIKQALETRLDRPVTLESVVAIVQ